MNNNHHGKKYNKKKKETERRERMYTNVLLRMFDRYKTEDEDWMGFKLTDNNTYTFHHIRERRNGGKQELENGAILTIFAHQFLNYLDLHCKRAYNDYHIMITILVIVYLIIMNNLLMHLNPK